MRCYTTLRAGACASLMLLGAHSMTNASDRVWHPPKTEHGHPDLQGLWDFGTKTPFVRPAVLGEKRAYSEDEAKEFEHKARQENTQMDAPVDLATGAPAVGDKIGQEADSGSMERRHDLTRVRGEYRTSIIIDPLDGQIPRRKEFVDYFGQIKARRLNSTDGPDTLDAPTRCLSPLPVPYIYPMPWSAFLEIVQSKDHVVLHSEMIHDARIVRLNATHSEHPMRAWMGDAVGHFEGNTLIVHTIRFRPEQSYSYLVPMSEDFELIERFTPVGADEIVHSFTVVDSQAYTRPFTGERTFKRADPRDRIVEFACHEGNYSIVGILAGARKIEADAAISAQAKSRD